jgi:hypothetical protein
MTLVSIEELVARLQSAASTAAAESAGSRIENRALPNQVLQPEAPRLTQLLLVGLPDASADGQAETWALLAMLTVGTCGPTAADADVVRQVRETLPGVLPMAFERLHDPVGSPCDYLVVDVLDAMMTYEDEPVRDVIAEALRSFGRRGARERQRIEIILGPS